MTFFKSRKELVNAIEVHNDLVRSINNMTRCDDEIREWTDRLNDDTHLYLDVQNRDGGIDHVDFTSSYKSLERNILNSYKRLKSYKEYQLQQLRLVDNKIKTLELEVSTSPLAHLFRCNVDQLNNLFIYSGNKMINV